MSDKSLARESPPNNLSSANDSGVYEKQGSPVASLPATSDNTGTSVNTANVPSVESSPPDETGGRKASTAFAQLVKGWENYLNQEKDKATMQTLQMLQDFRLGAPRQKSPGGSTEKYDNPAPLVPELSSPPFRHTRSSPAKTIPSMLIPDEGDEHLPPPVPLDPFQRSSSTPSAFRQHTGSSAFATVDRSAFTMLSSRGASSIYGYAAAGSDPGSGFAGYSAFDPVKYYARALEDMERTSIEVTDNRPSTDASSEYDAKPLAERGAAFRAARFLSDVRVLRRRRRVRSGRENPAQPPDSSPDAGCADLADDEPIDTCVTIITESEFNPNESSILSGSSEVSEIVKAASADPSSHAPNESDLEDGKDDDTPAAGHYHQLDSDVEDYVDHQYQQIEAQLHPESPATVPSPSYQQLVEYQLVNSPILPKNQGDSVRRSIRIQVSGAGRATNQAMANAASPSPTQMAEGNALTPQSHESATASPLGTNRSHFSGSSSGHTTHAPSTSSSSGGLTSGLSTISETDREVMEANKEGKRRRKLENLPMPNKGENDGTSVHSSSTTSTNPLGYVALENSPVPLRDGAVVPAYRFFTTSPTNGISVVGRSSSSKRSVNSEGNSATNTSTSSSSHDDPPEIVSCIDPHGTSDVVLAREAAESSSKRSGDCGNEEREGSPAEMMGYPEVLFQEAQAPKESSVGQNRIRVPAKKFRGRLERLRRRPPRSPSKGSRSLATPPPRGSVSPLYHQLSPPRNIVDAPDSSVSRPHVMRTSVSTVQSTIISMNDISAAEITPRSAIILASPIAGHLTQIAPSGADSGAQEVVTAPKSNNRWWQQQEGRRWAKVPQSSLVDTPDDVLQGESIDHKAVSASSHIVTPEKENVN